MKKAFTNFKTYIIAIALSAIGIGVPFGVCVLTLKSSPFPYPYLMAAFAFLFFLLGMLISDIQIALWKKKTQEYDTKLPNEVKEKAWQTRIPFYLATAVTLTAFLVLEIWYFVAGSFPLLS